MLIPASGRWVPYEESQGLTGRPIDTIASNKASPYLRGVYLYTNDSTVQAPFIGPIHLFNVHLTQLQDLILSPQTISLSPDLLSVLVTPQYFLFPS